MLGHEKMYQLLSRDKNEIQADEMREEIDKIGEKFRILTIPFRNTMQTRTKHARYNLTFENFHSQSGCLSARHTTW